TLQVPKKLSVTKTVVTLCSSHAAAALEGRNNRRDEMEKVQALLVAFLIISNKPMLQQPTGNFLKIDFLQKAWHVDCTTQLGVICKFAEGGLNPTAYVVDEDIQYWSPFLQSRFHFNVLAGLSFSGSSGPGAYSIAESGDVKVCEKNNCIWKGCREATQSEFRAVTNMKPSMPLEPEVRLHIAGLRNDYYLNILDWSLENLIAVAVGSAAHVWNGGTLQAIESIDLKSSSKYISSLAWIKEGTCLAIGTSDGEVQLWDIETKKRLRNMFGHLSVVGALSWNHYILSSGSRLGSIHHHDVRVPRHHAGTLCQNKQSICSLKWSLTNQFLASGSSDGILNIWPSDPGVKLQSQPLKTMPHSSAVKAMNWCPWQSKVLATGGGMKDGILRVWDINREKIIQSAATDSQVCSLLWLPKTSELMTAQGLPGNQMKIWKYPMLINSSELYGKYFT
ncbi:PREDICTED: cell division cycle protein 20 homolog B, partial [Pterocles gutturalis]|uniref:cell division cycle protein 20 homolog B n=1 Tax=Pterocles gutturalis TaxID=240206 RepID=UPI000528FA51